MYGQHKDFRVNVARQGGITALKNKLIANGTIRADQGKAVQEAVIRAAGGVYGLLEDLSAVTRNLGSIGIMVDGYERRSRKGDAGVGMRADRREDRDRLGYDMRLVPIPVYKKEFSVDIREAEASENTMGRGVAESIDTAEAEESGRSIVETFEKISLLGGDVGVDGAPLYGALNHPDRNSANIIAPWNVLADANPVQDIINAQQVNRDDGYRGPISVLYPDSWHGALISDYSAQKGTNTVLQRIQAIPEVQSVRPSSVLTNQVLVYQRTRDVVDLSMAQGLTVYAWTEQDGLSLHWASIFAAAARWKSDFNDKAGFCVVA